MNHKFIQTKRNFIWLGIFAIAMGFLEAIVAIYLRQLYYPDGFKFPLTMLTEEMIAIEWLREAATVIMLASIGIIAGKNNLGRFSYFLYTFAVWDIFYYIGLKLLIDWPSSLLTWDVLFLIPIVWIGPVLAPLICSLSMILLGGIIIYFQEKKEIQKLKVLEWVLIYLGAIVIFITFIWDYTKLIFSQDFLSEPIPLAENERFWNAITNYIPDHFNWLLFIGGEILIFTSIVLLIRRAKKIIS